MTSEAISGVGLAAATAIAAGMVGCFAVMRRMTLAADAISHVALPGIAVAVLLKLNPLLGALATLMLGAILIWAVERRTGVATETITGVVFSVALAIGAMLSSGDQLLDALFGAPGVLSGRELAMGVVASAAIVFYIVRERNSLIVALVSPEIAMTCGINVSRLNLTFLVVFALTVGLGLRYLGVLLMGSLVIIPAATARRLARSLNSMLAIAIAVALIATVGGSYAASLAGRESGPFIITVAGAIFFASLLRSTPA